MTSHISHTYLTVVVLNSKHILKYELLLHTLVMNIFKLLLSVITNKIK